MEPPETDHPPPRAGTLLESLARVAADTPSRFVLPPLIGLAAGITGWLLQNPHLVTQHVKNEVERSARLEAAVYVAVALVVVGLVYLVTAGLDRRRAGHWRASAVARVNRALCFVLAGPFLAAGLAPMVEKERPMFTLGCLVAAACACTPTLAFLLPRRQVVDAIEARLGRSAPWLAGLALALGWAAYGWFFSRLSIINHHALVTRVIDLGYYDNIFYQSIHGRPLGLSFIESGYHGSGHFDPILVVLSPLYLLYPRAEMLLVLQSVWLGAGVVPAYLLGQLELGSRWAGLATGAVYLLYPALHGTNLYEFHSLTLANLPLLWALYFLHRGRTVGYFVALAVVFLVREDMPLLLCFVGIYAALRGRARLGLVTIALSLAYFALAKGVFMTSSEVLMDGKFSYYYRDLIPEGESFGGLVTSLLTNPVYALGVALRPEKVEYILLLLAPLLMLPLLARQARFTLLYGAIFLLLASREPVFSIHFQYPTVVIPFLVACVPIAVRQLRDRGWSGPLGGSAPRWALALCGGVVIATALSAVKFGAIAPNASFKAGFRPIVRQLDEKQQQRYDALRAMVDSLEPGASVTVTNNIGAHVSNRKDVYLYQQARRTHYVLVDESDIRKQEKGWHSRRIARKELELLEAFGTLKLYRFHPDLEPVGERRGVPPAPAASAPASKRRLPRLKNLRDAGSP